VRATLRRLVPALVAVLVASCTVGSAGAATPGLRVGRQVQQLIVVSSPTAHPSRAIATLRAYDRASPASPWRLAFGPMPAETGYGGLKATRREGDGATPIGVFSIGATMYGTQPRPGRLNYAYHRLACGDWWDEDPSSPRYNQFVRLPCGQPPPFVGNSEALWTETTAYPYFALIDFNVNPVRRGAGAPGSGIFLHSWVGGPTAGCIAVHEVQLLRLLRWLRPSAHPRIAIGAGLASARSTSALPLRGPP
jgi:L,D-peptidoglycan transpeptidase YkuD (ErfK/YbiS/YcfS/YnhG family)